jgi:hypothetical protein
LQKIFESWREYSDNLLNEAYIDKYKGKLRSRRRSKPPRFFVIHHSMCKTPSCTYATLKKKGTSTHYEIDRKGNIVVFADPATETTFHSGKSSVNARSIGIDIGGNLYKKPMTPAQRASLYSLVHELAGRFNIPLTLVPDGYGRRGSKAKNVIEDGIGIIKHWNVVRTGCPGKVDLSYLTGGAAPQPIAGTTPEPSGQAGAPSKPTTPQDAVRAGGRFLGKYKKFATENPNFSFSKFYQELKDLYPGGTAAALPRHGADKKFGKEHHKAWLALQKIKGEKHPFSKVFDKAKAKPQTTATPQDKNEEYWFGKN